MLLLLWLLLPQVEDGGVLCAEENINRQVNVARGVSLATPRQPRACLPRLPVLTRRPSIVVVVVVVGKID